MKTPKIFSEPAMAFGIDSEIANEAELDLYFSDISPVEHASLLDSVDRSLDPVSMSLLLQSAWHVPAAASAGTAVVAH